MAERFGKRRYRQDSEEKPKQPWLSKEEKAALELEETLDESLANIGLNVRTANMLEEAGILYVRQLASMSRDQLLQIDNLGERTLQECSEALTRLKVAHPRWVLRANRR